MKVYRCAAGFVLVLALSAGAWATDIAGVTSIGSGKQIWIKPGSFDSATTSQFVNDNLPGTISGTSYYFAGESPATDQQSWYAEYSISASAVPGVSLTGTWYFWARITQATAGTDRYADSDWLFVKGDPGDGSGASWASNALSTAGDADKIFNNVGPYTSYAYGTWGWMTNSVNVSGANVLAPVAKQFNLDNGQITFRIDEREAGASNAQMDMIVWTNDPYYTPSDSDFPTQHPPVFGPGDLNHDHVVNDADYTAWADFFGKNPLLAHPTWGTGSDPSGGYNDADYTLWADHFGETTPSTPEPATMALLGLGVLGLIRKRRQ